MKDIAIELLSEMHQRGRFHSGSVALDQYIQKLATQHIRKNMARVFVAVTNHAPDVVGFYALSSFSVAFEMLPESHCKRLPKYPIPCALTGRLAVDTRFQGRGLGKTLLIDALARIVHLSETIAVHAIVVDAKDEKARRFYEHFGFLDIAGHPTRLFLPTETIRREFRS